MRIRKKTALFSNEQIYLIKKELEAAKSLAHIALLLNNKYALKLNEPSLRKRLNRHGYTIIFKIKKIRRSSITATGLSLEAISKIKQMLAENISISSISKEFDLSRDWFYEQVDRLGYKIYKSLKKI